jgi:hypothetical protein
VRMGKRGTLETRSSASLISRTTSAGSRRNGCALALQ